MLISRGICRKHFVIWKLVVKNASINNLRNNGWFCVIVMRFVCIETKVGTDGHRKGFAVVWENDIGDSFVRAVSN